MVLDQLTKHWALATLEGEPRIVIIDGFLELTFTRNSGSAFSLFQGNGPILAIIALGVVGLIVFVLRDASHRLEALALGLVLGGALGNLTDRVFRGDALLDGAVIDWIDLWWIPTFNVADAAITIGVAVLLLAAFVTRRG